MKKIVAKILSSVPIILRLPVCFTLCYLIIAFLFAIAYYLHADSFKVQGVRESLTFFDSVYYSIVTITTLGYGDIIPLSGSAKFLVAVESVLGIIVIGFALACFGYGLSTRQARIEQESENREFPKKQGEVYYIFSEYLVKFLEKYDANRGPEHLTGGQ